MSESHRKTAPGSQLDRLQRWMQTVIAHPAGIAEGIASEEARHNIDVALERLEEVVAPSRTLTAAERLAVYCRSYHTRLLQCFRAMFPALQRALGDELFNHFVQDYLQHHPPHSYTLDQLADAFPSHLAATRPDADAPPRERERWPDFIIELASLELAFLKVYDGAGCEGRALPHAPNILALSVEKILNVRPVPASCLRLFTFNYPVHAYLLAARRGETPVLPAPHESFVAMTRRNYRVTLHELSAPQYAFLETLDGHHTIAQVLNRDLRVGGHHRQPSVAVVRNWLCDWVEKGFFESIEVQRERVHP